MAYGPLKKKVLQNISVKINYPWNVPCERLAMIQLASYNGHFVDIHYIGRVSLQEIQIKSFLPYMVSKGQKRFSIVFGKVLFSD